MLSKIKILVVSAGLGLFLIAGCTQYASQDELRQLQEQCKAAAAAEQKVQELEKEKADMERQIKEKEAVVEKLTRDLEAVKE